MTYYNIKHTRKKLYIDGPEKSHRSPEKGTARNLLSVGFERRILDDNHIV